MTMLRGLAAVAVLTGTAVGAAGPAQADTPVMEGVYNYVSEGQTGSWTLYPSCVPTVGDLRVNLELPVACQIHVGPSDGLTGGDARMVGGRWSFTTPKNDGMECPDGTFAPTVEVFTFDETSGTRSISHSGGCGMPPGIINIPFTLTYKEPLAIPVDRYPLICEPGGLRRCF